MSNEQIALCLSGGGYRATLFEFGSLERLNELGVLSQVDTISSVSGGSLLAACFADYLLHGSPELDGLVYTNFSKYVGDKVRQLCSTDIRTGAAIARIKIGKGNSVDSLTNKLSEIITPVPLSFLQETNKQFIFCATDLMYGVLWVMSNQLVGSYMAGYINEGSDSWHITQAAAISACFPPVFDPFPVRESAERYAHSSIGPDQDAFSSAEHQHLRENMHLTDGGVYDNLGLEPVFSFAKKAGQSTPTILAIDGGKPFYADDDASSAGLGRLAQYNSIMARQVHALRVRYFIKARKHGDIKGAYWGIQQHPEKHAPGAVGYSEALSRDLIAKVRTDMDEFSPDEQAVLIKHGYELADAAIQKRAGFLLNDVIPDLRPPVGSTANEAHVRDSLSDSHKRVYLDFLSSRESRNKLV